MHLKALRIRKARLVTAASGDGTILFANEALATVLGFTQEALQRADDDIALVTFQDLAEQLWLEGR